MDNCENKYCVYKHTAPNGKVYIGITCQNPLRRWNNGKGYAENSYFSNAIVKYGWDNIKHEILFDNLTKEEACQKEIDLIAEHKSNIADYGYNISSGGECANAGTCHFIGKEIDGFEILGTENNLLKVRCKKCGALYRKNYPCGNSHWKCECMKTPKPQPREYLLITYNGKTQTATEWAKETGISRSTISHRFYNGMTSDEIFNMPIREYKRRVEKMYEYCGKEFKPMWTGNVFCSKECSNKSRQTRQIQKCACCGNDFLGEAYRESKYCSLECYHKARWGKNEQRKNAESIFCKCGR